MNFYNNATKETFHKYSIRHLNQELEAEEMPQLALQYIFLS
jgi:hypothetical protein